MKFRSTVALTLGLSCLLGWGTVLLAAEPEVDALGRDYAAAIRPLVARYCDECHSQNLAEADLNLTAFAAFGDVRKRPRAWQKVREMLDQRMMPPPESKQLTADEREFSSTG